MDTEYLDQLAEQLKAEKSPACRRAINRLLADESLRLRLVSKSKGFSLASLRGPIVLTGTLKQPAVRPEMGNVAVRGALAMALVRRHGISISEEKVYFPVARSAATFGDKNSAGRKLLDGFPAKERDEARKSRV